ncbi:MAG: hypothetical protein KAX33_00865 [Candidatus Lokiarchaeota archaeon]|nr:hypothetical protein [Candidatus Lokiarchaeota archaeon]
MDRLLEILRKDKNYSNFTLDGQTIPVLDYLEVKPQKRKEIEKYVKEGRLSIGPFFILPDEFLISGESLIRNLMLGHKIANSFGRVMKAGYIPDPFGHIAQLPQILSGFELPSFLFMRGFGNEFEENNLNMEFNWQSPGNAASVLAIHLILGYGSIANINTSTKNGEYLKALRQIRNRVKKLEKYTASDVLLLNNGSDHLYAQPEISSIVKQWNEKYGNEKILIQQDFEYYINEVLKSNPKLKNYQGELRWGKYFEILTGVLSTRMWIKQQNTKIEYLYEKFAEPFSAMAWALDNSGSFEYPKDYLWTGWTWLLKNHPHDSICGCSIDEVHQEMKTRFQWSEQIGNEILKDSFLEIVKQVKLDLTNEKKIALFILNPLPWARRDITYFDLIFPTTIKSKFCPEPIKLTDLLGLEIPTQNYLIEGQLRLTIERSKTYRFTFIADVPAMGYKVYFLSLGEKSKTINKLRESSLNTKNNILENSFFKIIIDQNGALYILDKESGIEYRDICIFEDVGDWGDEYDYSWPKNEVGDERILSIDFGVKRYNLIVDGPTQITAKIEFSLNIPISLSEDRSQRSNELVENPLSLSITIYENTKRIDFKVEYTNKSKDHRLRVLFPTNIKSKIIHADGHFYVVPRNIELPNDEKWIQKALRTNHEKDFIAINDDKICFAVLNKGLPEYEAIQNEDNSITLAITLLRCIGRLSGTDLATRRLNAGPILKTTEAQCLGNHSFEFSLIIQNGLGDWMDSKIHIYSKEYNCPLLTYVPLSVNSLYRAFNKLFLNGIKFLTLPLIPKPQNLPLSLSFLKIDNLNIQLSALKKAEDEDFLIVRLINMSSKIEKAKLIFYNNIENPEILNLLEEQPVNKIKAIAKQINSNQIEVTLDPHVLANIKVDILR